MSEDTFRSILTGSLSALCMIMVHNNIRRVGRGDHPRWIYHILSVVAMSAALGVAV